MRKLSRIAKTIMLLLIFSSTPSFSETPVGFAGEKVDLNAATLEELDTLPHVGKYTAQRIIELRPITEFDALLGIKGMTAEKVEALKQLTTLGKEKDSNSFEITMAGAPVKVTRIGDGPQGVIIFGHSGSKQMVRYLKTNTAGLGDLLPSKISLFLWEYPSVPPFDQVQAIIQNYREDNTAKLAISGIASNVVSQIRQKTDLKEFLLVANSLGAGVVLQDYGILVGDKALAFLLISPTESFMPPVETIPPLERTTILAARGWGEGKGTVRTDPFLRGVKAWDWMAKNRTTEWGDLITKSGAPDPSKVKITDDGTEGVVFNSPTNFDAGHFTIGDVITAELLGKLIRVKLGWSDKAILAEPPKQR